MSTTPPSWASALRNGGHRSVDRAAIGAMLRLGGCLFDGDDEAIAAVDALLDELDAAGLPAGLDGRFDPTEVVNLMIAEGVDGRSAFWRNRYVATGQRLVFDLARERGPRRFEIAFARCFDLSRHVPGTRLRLRLPMPIADAHLSDLSITVEQGPAQTAIMPGRLEAKIVVGDLARVTVAARIGFTAHPGVPHGDAPSPREGETWLAEREGQVAVTPRVRALAHSLGGSDAADRVRRFRDHLVDAFVCGPVHPDRIGPGPATDWVLDQRRYDCRLGAALLVALCRASGIPARLIGGYLLWAAPTEHYWVEIWLPDQGWTPHDLLAWDLSAGGRDAAWRDIYAGAVDYRMKTQVFPDIFTGAPGVTMPPALQRLARAIDGGTETRFVTIPDGAALYTDTIRILTK